MLLPSCPFDTSMAFNAGAGSGLGKSTSYRLFGSLGRGGLDQDSVQSRESVVGVPVTTGPSFGAGTVS